MKEGELHACSCLYTTAVFLVAPNNHLGARHMFTGIIDHTGTIVDVLKTAKGLRFTIATQFHDLKLGESITIDGVCFTVTDIVNTHFSCDVSPETITRTICKHYRHNSLVNLERSLRLSDRLGGHYVTGHVDRTAQVKEVTPHADYVEVHLTGFAASDLPFIIPKGSLTVNGVSLTINALYSQAMPQVHLMLIPHTLEITNLKNLKRNDDVNIEFDHYTKTIAHQLSLYMQHQEISHVS